MSIGDILCLPAAERILIVERIWDSLRPEDIEITEAQKKEIDYRKELDRKGEMTWHSWSEVKKGLRSQYK